MSELEHFLEALVAYERALQIDPHYAAAYYGQGRVYTILGREKEAKEAFEKSAALNAISKLK